MLIGDLNCDLSRPDKGAKEGKTLMDLMDVSGLTNLIKVSTRVVVESSSLIDVILTNKPRSMKEMLYTMRCLKSNEDMILALAGQFKQLSHEPEKFR